MNIKEVVTEADLRCISCITAIANKTFKRRSKFFISKMKEENYKLFSLRNEENEVVSLAGVAICTNFIMRNMFCV